MDSDWRACAPNVLSKDPRPLFLHSHANVSDSGGHSRRASKIAARLRTAGRPIVGST